MLRIVGAPEGEGRERRIAVVMLDVTEPAEVRLELERTLERLALATHGGGIGVWELDLQAARRGELAWDDTMWRLHGEPPHGQRQRAGSRR